MKDIIKLGSILLIVCGVAAGALSLTYIVTGPRIKSEKEKETNRALLEIMPEAKEFRMEVRTVDGKEVSLFIGTSGSAVKGAAFAVAPKGYAGPIEMLVGIGVKGAVSGVKILSLSETPGLGLNATSPKFLAQFIGKTIESKLKARQDIDALTGATISSQAVAEGVREALGIFKKVGLK